MSVPGRASSVRVPPDSGRGHQHKYSLLPRIRLGSQQVVLLESRFDTLNRMEVAVFPQQQRAKLCSQCRRPSASKRYLPTALPASFTCCC